MFLPRRSHTLPAFFWRSAGRVLELLLWASLESLAGCAPSFEVPSRPEPPSLSLTFDPPRLAHEIAGSSRLVVTARNTARTPQVRLFRGTLSEAELRSLDRAAPSAALVEREVALTPPHLHVEAETSTTTLAPQSLLSGDLTLWATVQGGDGQTISRHFELVTLPDEPTLRRLFPLGTQAVPVHVYCGPEHGFPLSTVALFPEGVAEIRPSAPDCFEVAVLRGGGVLPPQAPSGATIAPDFLPTTARSDSEAPRAACIGEIFDNLCVRVEDDRLVFLGEHDLVVDGAVIQGRLSLATRFTLGKGRAHVVKGLLSDSDFRVALRVVDGQGARDVFQVGVTKPATRHIVINEVLPRPPSGNPTQRYVELVADGSRTVSLAGLRLLDGAKEHALPPDVFLEPGEFLLVVPEGFADSLVGSAAPPAATKKVRLKTLSLNNDLLLVDADDTIVSRFPKNNSTRTLPRIRTTPSAPDDDPASFTLFERQTPGVANH